MCSKPGGILLLSLLLTTSALGGESPAMSAWGKAYREMTREVRDTQRERGVNFAEINKIQQKYYSKSREAFVKEMNADFQSRKEAYKNITRLGDKSSNDDASSAPEKSSIGAKTAIAEKAEVTPKPSPSKRGRVAEGDDSPARTSATRPVARRKGNDESPSEPQTPGTGKLLIFGPAAGADGQKK